MLNLSKVNLGTKKFLMPVEVLHGILEASFQQLHFLMCENL